MNEEGTIKRLAISFLIFKDSGIKPEWTEIQAGQKAKMFGQSIIVYDTGTIVISVDPNKKEQNQVVRWLCGLKDDVERKDWTTLLIMAREYDHATNL